MRDGPVVRSAVREDLPQIIALERATPEAPHWSEAEYVSNLTSVTRAESAERCFLVAEFDERIVGYAVARLILRGRDGFSELETIAVEAGLRRRGFGEALCMAIVDWSRRVGVGEMQLEVRAGSAGAIAFYAGLGFTAVGRRTAYYQKPVEDAVLMQLKSDAN